MLDVAFQCVDEGAVQEVPDYLRNGRGVTSPGSIFAAPGSAIAADANDKQFVGAEVQRRADRGKLPECAIAEILVLDLGRGEQGGDGGGCHQVVRVEQDRTPESTRAAPAHKLGAALEERH